MKAFIRAMRTRMSRYAVRIFARNRNAAKNTSGRTLNDTSASCQFMRSIAATMNVSVKMSPKTVTRPELNSVFRVSTSLVIRVISRPTGFLS